MTSHSDDEMKKAEQRGYSRGYQAGKRRRTAEQHRARRESEERAFWDRAFLHALPACIQAHGWKSGDQPITSRHQRTELAAGFADDALKQRRQRH